MATVIPFKAVRPQKDKVALVTCRNYEDYSASELVAWLSFNPYSFLHIINPAYVRSRTISWEQRFRGVRHKFQDFKRQKIFLEDDDNVFYIYQIEDKWHSYTGIIAGTSVADYTNDVIKKHEDTLEYRVELFKDYLQQSGFNTEPVLMTYPDSADINNWITAQKKNRAMYEFSTTNKEKHTLWKIAKKEDILWLQNHFTTIPNLYIADGHHRSKASAILRNQTSNSPKLDYFMSFLIAESNIKIYEYNRIIRDLNHHTKDEFLFKIAQHFSIKLKGQELWKPKNKFEFGMYLDGNFYALHYKNNGKNTQKNPILANLDTQILYDTVLHPILGIGDMRNDERIDYISGKESITEIKDIVDNGEFEVGFTLFPSDINEIKTLADNNLIMPPKSTYIEPKFRSGLVVYEH